MSPALKSAVWARGPASNTVMRPSPLIQYCHSSALGCQCSSRIPPGFTVSSAAAIVVETRKLVLSARRMLPERVFLMGFVSPSDQVKGLGGVPPDATAAWSSTSGPGSLPWKIQRS